ncbi:MAG: DUF4349 domain-containing protein [Lachnospiraceae bacterium]|nr:DUF4349 domain-containing protein [Lachnospiraceae bacterium]
MKKIQKLAPILTVCAMLMMSACSAGSVMNSTSSGGNSGNYAAAEEAKEDIYDEDVSAAGMTFDEAAMEDEAKDWEDSETEETAAPGDVVATETAEQTAEDAAAKLAKKIVYSGSMTVETTEYEKTIGEIEALMQKYGAVITSSSESDDNSSWYISDSNRHSSRTMNWEIRIPSKNFQTFFDSTGEITGSVRSKNTSSNDMTKRYNDTAVQIESLTIQQENLMKMMESAQTIEEMLAIEDRLSEVRYELKLLTNANSQIDYDVQYSQVSIYVNEVYEYAKEPPETFTERLKRSLSGSAEGFVEFLQDLLVAIIYLFPYLIVFGIILFIVFRLAKKARAKMPKREKKPRRGKVTQRQEYAPMPPMPEEPAQEAPREGAAPAGEEKKTGE